jgi:predicted Fe-Mo cluster-binding NifX family protein
MKIAVASQNRKTVTGHAGKCRKFWVFEVDAKAIVNKSLLDLPIEQSLHAFRGPGPHPLQGAKALITGGMGDGLARRLAGMGIEALVTSEVDPDQAAAAWLAGTLPLGQPHAHGHHDHPRGHAHD